MKIVLDLLQEHGVEISHVTSGKKMTVFLKPSAGNATEEWAVNMKRLLKHAFDTSFPGRQDYPGRYAPRRDIGSAIKQFSHHVGLSIVEPGNDVISQAGKPLAWHVAVSEKDRAGASLLKILMSMYGKK